MGLKLARGCYASGVFGGVFGKTSAADSSEFAELSLCVRLGRTLGLHHKDIACEDGGEAQKARQGPLVAFKNG